ncbi:peptide deformylase [Clostridium sp. HCP1S3_B4]|uniref:peptide deformylase n=1 Tax=unclassified Clostridium TaxID=2614128 RepID=UPI0016B33842|nr:peptide deformylase [Clostridiales bacterium]MDY2730600.1 peptide deformylase [Clostridium sp.]NLK23343.1 peptide deformylase [Clostridiales bacterium]
MALRNIRIEGDEILRKKCRKVEKIDKSIITLIQDMAETMYKADGVGIAAPQVGILKRIFVIDIYDDTGLKVFINPEILEAKGSQIGEEGCLSLPGKSEEVERPNYVKVKALNEKGEEFILEAEELLARAVCHENDHLDGILYIDHVK